MKLGAMASAFEYLQKPEKWLKIEKIECIKKQGTILKKEKIHTK